MFDIKEIFIQIVKVFSLYQIISQKTTITYLNTTEFIEQNFECQLLDDNCELFWEISVSRLEFKNRINQFKLSFFINKIQYTVYYIRYTLSIWQYMAIAKSARHENLAKTKIRPFSAENMCEGFLNLKK